MEDGDDRRIQVGTFIELTLKRPPNGGDQMKLLYFDDFRLGVLKGDTVVDVSKTVQSIPHTGPHDLINGLIERFADYRKKLDKAAAGGRRIPVKRVKIRPPLPQPYNIHCMAVHYMEDGTRSPPAPLNPLHQSPTSVIRAPH